jgi:RNA polymerase sigma-70 factor (ECF subfamily)
LDPPHSPPIAVDLLRRARQGDADALTALYRAYAPMLLPRLQRLAGARAEAEDVLQDLFVALPEALRHYGERGQFEGWLVRVAIRLALNRMRTGARRRESPLDAAVADFGGPARSAADGVIDRIALERAIGALPDALRTVFVLREVEGYSHQEIAGLLGISRAASEVRMFRAVRQLRVLLS